MIVLLELLTALLEYIDLILQMSFFQQEFILSHKYLTYYAGIMLNAFRYLLCSKLCQHNRRVPIEQETLLTLLQSIAVYWAPGGMVSSKQTTQL